MIQLQVHVIALLTLEGRSPLWEGNVKKPMYWKFYIFRKITLNVGGVSGEYQVTMF